MINDDIKDKYFDIIQSKIKELISQDPEISTNDVEKFNTEIFNQSSDIQYLIKEYIDKASENGFDVDKVAKTLYDNFKTQVKNNIFAVTDMQNVPNHILGERNFIKTFEDFKLYENNELSGKYSFKMFLQIISNHDYHFILNDFYRNLYKYHLFFSSETIKDNNQFIEIFKYKHSLPLAYKVLLNVKDNKLSFFFGLKDNSIVRYGFTDIETQRSYIVGEFGVSNAYFNEISNYKAMRFVNKILQDVNVKKLPLLAKIKHDLDKFYVDKNGKTILEKNRVIKVIDKDIFTEDDIKLNRLYRTLKDWVQKREWRNNVELSVDDENDPIQFIIILK